MIFYYRINIYFIFSLFSNRDEGVWWACGGRAVGVWWASGGGGFIYWYYMAGFEKQKHEDMGHDGPRGVEE